MMSITFQPVLSIEISPPRKAGEGYWARTVAFVGPDGARQNVLAVSQEGKALGAVVDETTMLRRRIEVLERQLAEARAEVAA